MTDSRSRKGDRYPGATHPAVGAARCPTCHAKPGQHCIVGSWKPLAKGERPYATRTHRTRLNLWRVGRQSEGHS